jgi:hypothetical protein
VTIGGIVVYINMAVFLYATLFDGQADNWNNSTSILQIVGSFVFNAGYFFPLVIVSGISIVAIERVLAEYRTLIYISTAIVLVLLPSILIMSLKPNVFRADFLYGAFHYRTLLLCSCVMCS